MSKANGYVLHIPDDRRERFGECREAEQVFGEPVPDFAHSRSVPLVCFIMSVKGDIQYIAQGRRGVRSGTGLRRLNVSEVVDLHRPIPYSSIEELLPKRHKQRVLQTLKKGGLLTPKSFDAFVAALLEHHDELKSLLDRYSASFRQRIENIPPKAKESLAFQKEAVLTALALGHDKRESVPEWKETIQEWAPPTQGQPSSFLEGLPVARIREDPMVVHDLTKLPGFDLVKTLPYGAAIFESETTRVTIVLANRQPLEEQLGVDLIYFNETFQCFVMVQYKAMEADRKLKEIFRLPNDQLDKEIERMEHVLFELAKCQAKGSCDGFRLNENPFFLKLCRRMVFNPDDVSQADGMYLPLGYWRHLSADKRIEGPQGGKGVRYANVTRYFDNGSFVSLVSNAWIGSTPEQSSVLSTAIRSTIESGKAIVIAVKTPKPRPINGKEREQELLEL